MSIPSPGISLCRVQSCIATLTLTLCWNIDECHKMRVYRSAFSHYVDIISGSFRGVKILCLSAFFPLSDQECFVTVDSFFCVLVNICQFSDFSVLS